jgi:hypothetical protein
MCGQIAQENLINIVIGFLLIIFARVYELGISLSLWKILKNLRANGNPEI